MKKVIMMIALTFVSIYNVNAQDDKRVTKSAHINFYSHTSIEDISSDNYAVTSALTPSTGDVVFSVPMQSFKFDKSMMQKHFNSKDFLDTKQYPKAKFKGKIKNLSAVNFKKDGKHEVTFSGKMTIHGVTKDITEKGTINVSGGKYTLNLKMKVALADYKIALKEGKPSTNVAKDIDVTVKAEYK